MDASVDEPSTPTAPMVSSARFEMSARILGPKENDDASDLRIELREMNGVGANLNLLVLTCTNRVQQGWDGGNVAAERGSNRIGANATVVLVRAYECRSSARPSRLEAQLIDANGAPHTVVAIPFHPDWPGV